MADQPLTDGDHIVIIGGTRYRREDAAARGLVRPAGDSTSEAASQQKDARIAELEAKLAELEKQGASADPASADADAGSASEDEPEGEEQAPAGKTRPAPPNKARSAAAK